MWGNRILQAEHALCHIFAKIIDVVRDAVKAFVLNLSFYSWRNLDGEEQVVCARSLRWGAANGAGLGSGTLEDAHCHTSHPPLSSPPPQPPQHVLSTTCAMHCPGLLEETKGLGNHLLP